MTTPGLASLHWQGNLVCYSRSSWPHPVIKWFEFRISCMLKPWLCSIAYCFKIKFGKRSWGKSLALCWRGGEKRAGRYLTGTMYEDKSNVNRCCGAWSDLLCGFGTLSPSCYVYGLISNHSSNPLRGLPSQTVGVPLSGNAWKALSYLWSHWLTIRGLQKSCLLTSR